MMWKNSLFTLTLMIILTLSVSPAQAENGVQIEKVRIGAGVGIARMTTRIPGRGKFKANVPTYLLNLGYELTPAWEAGVALTGMGTRTATNTTDSVQVNIPMRPQAYVRGRNFFFDDIGAYGLATFGPVKHSINGTAHKERSLAVGLGAGLSWQFDPKYILDAGLYLPGIPVFYRDSGLDTSMPGLMVSLNYALGDYQTGQVKDEVGRVEQEPDDYTDYAGAEPEPQPFVPEEPDAAGTPAAEPPADKPEYKPSAKVEPKDQLWVVVSFRSGHVGLGKKTLKTLHGLAAKFLSQARSHTLDIQGYADAEPIGGYPGKRHKPIHSFRTLQALSVARAESVARALIDAGIDSNLVHSDGYGATNFIAGNDTRAGRSKNRRVEIHLVSK